MRHKEQRGAGIMLTQIGQGAPRPVEELQARLDIRRQMLQVSIGNACAGQASPVNLPKQRRCFPWHLRFAIEEQADGVRGALQIAAHHGFKRMRLKPVS